MQVVTARPSAEDCGGNSQDTNISSKWSRILYRYSGGPSTKYKDINYTLDAFKTDMNELLKSPELINCSSYYSDSYDGDGYTGIWIAYRSAHYGSVEGAKWAVSKGADLTIRYSGQFTAYDLALHLAASTQFLSKNNRTAAEYLEVAQILKPPPAPATKSCAEVDGQTPPANEYCIVAENMQESFKARLVVPGFDGYEHKTTAVSSGVGFRKDWKSTIIFICRAPAGQSCEGLPYADDPLGPGIDADNFELYVRCGNTINLLDVDSIDGGKSETIDVIEVTNEYPYSRNCTAKSSQPFTLSIKTTRLAQ